jgi:hypothetical protein
MLEQTLSLWFETTQQDVLVEVKPPSAAFGPLLRTVFEVRCVATLDHHGAMLKVVIQAIFEVFLMCLMGWCVSSEYDPVACRAQDCSPFIALDAFLWLLCGSISLSKWYHEYSLQRNQ